MKRVIAIFAVLLLSAFSLVALVGLAWTVSSPLMPVYLATPVAVGTGLMVLVAAIIWVCEVLKAL